MTPARVLHDSEPHPHDPQGCVPGHLGVVLWQWGFNRPRHWRCYGPGRDVDLLSSPAAAYR